jgi:hypothetical protein
MNIRTAVSLLQRSMVAEEMEGRTNKVKIPAARPNEA